MSLYMILDKMRESTPPDVRAEALKYRDMPLQDVLELLALITLTHGYAIKCIVAGDTSNIQELKIEAKQ